MPRLTHKLTAAMFTFLLGVLAATLWLSPGLRHTLLNLRRLSPPDDGAGAVPYRAAGGACEQWAKAEVVGQGLGWDLTYRSTVERTGYCPGGTYCKEWTKPQPPVHRYFADWQGEPIISSMEMELPDGHAGYGIVWLIRTKDHAYSWTFSTSDLDKPLNKTPFPPEHYDSMFDQVACWEQDEPAIREFQPGGYIGFLSLYKEGRARQMLLTYDDIYEGSYNADEAQPGRFTRALLPLVRWAAEQDKQSTPDQR